MQNIPFVFTFMVELVQFYHLAKTLSLRGQNFQFYHLGDKTLLKYVSHSPELKSGVQFNINYHHSIKSFSQEKRMSVSVLFV